MYIDRALSDVASARLSRFRRFKPRKKSARHKHGSPYFARKIFGQNPRSNIFRKKRKRVAREKKLSAEPPDDFRHNENVSYFRAIVYMRNAVIHHGRGYKRQNRVLRTAYFNFSFKPFLSRDDISFHFSPAKHDIPHFMS